MRYVYVLFCVMTLSVKAFCQSTTATYDFVGALITEDQTVISYKISFDEVSNGIIKGVSNTDFLGINSTKSKISGKIDHSKNLLSFKEISNISTKSDEEEKYFCYVEVSKAKIKTIKGKSIVNATFIGRYKSGEDCARGTLYLVSSNIIDDIKPVLDTMKGVNTDTLNKLKSILAEAEKSANKKEREIKKDDNLKIVWRGEYIIFDVWDGNKEDNDMINIYFNGKLIEENLIIKNTKKTIAIPFKGDSGAIRIKAVNEGDEIPNTVSFLLHDGKSQNPFISSLNKGEEFTIKFSK